MNTHRGYIPDANTRRRTAAAPRRRAASSSVYSGMSVRSIEAAIAADRRNARRRNILAVLALLVVVATALALMLPGVSATKAALEGDQEALQVEALLEAQEAVEEDEAVVADDAAVAGDAALPAEEQPIPAAGGEEIDGHGEAAPDVAAAVADGGQQQEAGASGKPASPEGAAQAPASGEGLPSGSDDAADGSAASSAKGAARAKAQARAAATGEPSIEVSIESPVSVANGLERASVNTTVYFAITRDATNEYEYIEKDGEPWLESIEIADGIPQGTAVFEGLEDGHYEVWELARINGKYVKQYNGLKLGDGFQIHKISAQNSSYGVGNDALVGQEDPHPTVTFKNTYSTPTQSKSFTMNKVWWDRGNHPVAAPEGACIEFTLYAESGGQTTEVRSIWLDGEADGDGEFAAWKATFENLPVKDDAGRDIKYKVKETTTWPDYYPFRDQNLYMGDAGNEYNDNDGGTIINKRLVGKLELHKHFDLQRPNYAIIPNYAANLRFTLTNETTGQTWLYTLADFNWDGNTDFKLIVADMPFGSYTFREYGYKSFLPGYRWQNTQPTVVNGELQFDKSAQEPSPSSLRINDEYREGTPEPDGAYVGVKKTWDDMDDLDGLRPASIQVELLANGQPYQGQGVANPVTLDGQNNWAAAWYELPERDADGNAIDYTISEVDVPEGYESSISQMVTTTDRQFNITNRHTPSGTGSLKVTKRVTGSVADQAPAEFGISIRDAAGNYVSSDGALSATPQTLAIHDGQTLVFEGLPLGSYTVGERDAAVEGLDWTLTYGGAANADGTVTVTRGAAVEAVLNNAYAEESEPAGPGQITLRKSVEGAAVPSGKYYYVTVKAEHDGKAEYISKLYESNGSLAAKLGQKPMKIAIPVDQEVVIGGLPVGTYTVEEDATRAQLDGYDLNVEYWDRWNSGHQAQSLTYYNEWSYTYPYFQIRNKYTKIEEQPGTLQLKVQKQWFEDGADVTANAPEASATMQLVRYKSEKAGTTVHFIGDGYAHGDATVPSNGSVTLSSADKFKAVVSAAPYNKDWKQVWTVTNGALVHNVYNAGNSLAFNPNGSADVYVYVFDPAPTLEITVSPILDASAGGEPVREELDKTVTVTADSDWEWTFNNLPLGGAEGGKNYEYRYAVQEVSPDGGYATTYSVGGSAFKDALSAADAIGTAGTSTIVVRNEKSAGELPSSAPLRIVKVDQERHVLPGATFSFRGGDIDEGGLASGDDGVVYENPELPVGEYTLSELSAPDGYQRVVDDIAIAVALDGTDVKVSASMGGKPVKAPDLVQDPTTGTWVLQVMNTSGVVLPSTGGMGVVPFTLGGFALVALAALLLLARRRPARIR